MAAVVTFAEGGDVVKEESPTLAISSHAGETQGNGTLTMLDKRGAFEAPVVSLLPVVLFSYPAQSSPTRIIDGW